MRKFIKSISIVTLATNAGTASATCGVNDLPAHAYEIATTCALYDSFANANAITEASLLTCAQQFSHGAGEYAYQMVLHLTPSVQVCATAIVAYAKDVFGVRAGKAVCGDAPTGTTLWETNLPASLSSSECVNLLATRVAGFVTANSFDIRIASSVKCSGFVENAYEIATTCALFDPTNLVDVTTVALAQLLACVAQFAHASGNYGYEMHQLLSGTLSGETSDCAISMVNYARSVLGNRSNKGVCGVKPAGTTLWDTKLPVNLHVSACYEINSPELKVFFSYSDFDIRDEAQVDGSCELADLPENAYEILTTCALLDVIPLAKFSDISFAKLLTCADQFTHALPGDYGYEMHMILTDAVAYETEGTAYSSHCVSEFLLYAKRVYLLRPASGTPCGAIPSAPSWENGLPAGLRSDMCIGDFDTTGLLDSALSKFETENYFKLTYTLPSGCGVDQYAAFEIITTCVLYSFDDPSITSNVANFPRFIDITVSNMNDCVGNFIAEGSSYLAENFSAALADSTDSASTVCTIVMMKYARNIFAQRENRALCGKSPLEWSIEGSPAPWDYLVPSGIAARSPACTDTLVLGLEYYQFHNVGGSRAYDMGPATCTPDRMPAHAFEIASACAIFDTTNLPTLNGASVTLEGLILCVETNFALDYRSEMRTHLESNSLGGCAFEIVTYANSIHGTYQFPYSCGTGSPEYPTLEIYGRDPECMAHVQSGLNYFYEQTGFDIRDPSSPILLESGIDLPDNAFEIVTNCVLFTSNPSFYSLFTITADALADCAKQFAHSEVGDYGKEVYELLRFTTPRTSAARTALIDWAKLVFVNMDGMDDVDTCGDSLSPSSTPWTEEDVWYDASDDFDVCLENLSGALSAFFSKYGFDIRENTKRTACLDLPETTLPLITNWLGSDEAEYYSYLTLESFVDSYLGEAASPFLSDLLQNAPDSSCALAIVDYARGLKTMDVVQFYLLQLASNNDNILSVDQLSGWSASSWSMEKYMSVNTVPIINFFAINHDQVSTTCTSVPSNAFAVLATCALFDNVNFDIFSDLTMENLLGCVERFTHATSSSYAFALESQLATSISCTTNCPLTDCSLAMLNFARNVFTQRSKRSVCGVVPTNVAQWELRLPAGISQGLPACMNLLTPSLSAFEDANGFAIRTDACWVEDIPANAYAIAATCALFDSTNLSSSTSLSVSQFLACVSSFDHEGSGDFAYDMFTLFTNDSGSACAAAIKKFALDVKATAINDVAACGTAPSAGSDWSQNIPDGLLTGACFLQFPTALETFYQNNNELDIRYADLGPCTLYELRDFFRTSPGQSLNAFTVASTCALFDTVNLVELKDISHENMLKCIARFSHALSTDLGTGMYALFNEEPSACSAAILKYAKRLHPHGGTTACGTPAPPTTETSVWGLSSVLTSDLPGCVSDVLSNGLEGFRRENGIDIRDGDFGACDTLASMNAFEIATVCGLFDTAHMPNLASVTYANFPDCMNQFSVAYNGALASIFASAESDCTHAVLSYVRDLVDLRSDAEICGALPLLEVPNWDATHLPTQVAAYERSCLALLSSSLRKFYLANEWDLIDETNNFPCSAAGINTMESSYYTLELIRDCQVNNEEVVIDNADSWTYPDFETCIGNSQLSDVCTDCYEKLWDSLLTNNFGTDICNEASVYTDKCATELYDLGILENFRTCSAGHEISFSARTVCNPSDASLEPYIRPFRFVQDLSYQDYHRRDADVIQAALSKVFGFTSFALSPCWECYSKFYQQMATVLRSSRMMDLCGDGTDPVGVFRNNVPDYSSRMAQCVAFLQDTQNPLSEFVKCAKFDLTIDMHLTDFPTCTDNDETINEADNLSLIPLIECVNGLADVNIRIDTFLASEEDGGCAYTFAQADETSDQCNSCFQTAQIRIFDILLTPGGRRACHNPYSLECELVLAEPMDAFSSCASNDMALTLTSVIACETDSLVVSQNLKDKAIEIAIEFGLAETPDSFESTEYNPRTLIDSLSCYPCFGGFMDRLGLIPAAGKTACSTDRGSIACRVFANEAISYFESCSGWTVDWSTVAESATVITSCSDDWAKINPLYKSHAPLLQSALYDIPRPDKYHLNGSTAPPGCSACFTQYYQDVKDLMVSVPVTEFACTDPHSDVCIAILSVSGGVLDRFESCTDGHKTLSLDSPYTCPSDVLGTIFAPLGLGEMILQNIALSATTEAAALYALNVTLTAAISDNILSVVTFKCQPCFESLVSSITKMPAMSKSICLDDFEARSCIIESAHILKAFEACAGGRFEIAPPAPPANSLSRQETPKADETLTTEAPTDTSSKSSVRIFAAFSMFLLAAW